MSPLRNHSATGPQCTVNLPLSFPQVDMAVVYYDDFILRERIYSDLDGYASRVVYKKMLNYCSHKVDCDKNQGPGYDFKCGNVAKDTVQT